MSLSSEFVLSVAWCANRAGDMIHSLMRFSLVINMLAFLFGTYKCFHVFRPHHWACRNFVGDISRSIHLCSVDVFVLKFLVTFTNLMWIERNFPLVKMECCVVL